MKKTAKMVEPLERKTAPNPGDEETLSRSRLHLRFGWWSLLVFLSLGLGLESLHGFKVGWYLDVGNESRRLMWTLAHAHGTLLALLNIVFGLSLRAKAVGEQRSYRPSRCLLAASLLLPSGFFLGGVFIHAGDPGMGVLLVPIGAALLFIAVFLTARGTTDLRSQHEEVSKRSRRKP